MDRTERQKILVTLRKINSDIIYDQCLRILGLESDIKYYRFREHNRFDEYEECFWWENKNEIYCTDCTDISELPKRFLPNTNETMDNDRANKVPITAPRANNDACTHPEDDYRDHDLVDVQCQPSNMKEFMKLARQLRINEPKKHLTSRYTL